MLANAAESSRLFYKMMDNILYLKEMEERARQAAGRREPTPDPDVQHAARGAPNESPT